MSDTLDTRRADLETYIQVARGRVAAAEERLADEKAGYYQVEGRYMEVLDLIASQPDPTAEPTKKPRKPRNP
jgi:hypothetical protein